VSRTKSPWHAGGAGLVESRPVVLKWQMVATSAKWACWSPPAQPWAITSCARACRHWNATDVVAATRAKTSATACSGGCELSGSLNAPCALLGDARGGSIAGGDSIAGSGVAEDHGHQAKAGRGSSSSSSSTLASTLCICPNSASWCKTCVRGIAKLRDCSWRPAADFTKAPWLQPAATPRHRASPATSERCPFGRRP
jgi:hypothetical protein